MKKRLFRFFWAFCLASFSATFAQNVDKQFSNADQKETGLSISNDGKTAVFFSEKGKNKRVMASSRLNQQSAWSSPTEIVILTDKLRNGHQINHLALSGDGNTLYFSGVLPDTHGGEDIYVSQKNGNEWNEPANLGDPVNTALYDGQPSLLADGSKLAFVRENFNKVGNIDCSSIWVCEGAKNANWGMPQQLPEPLNLDCDQYPFLMNDGNSIIFSSIREGGSGKFDFYQSELQGNGRWSLPVGLTFLNTERDETKITLFGKNETVYWSNGSDILSANLPSHFRGASLMSLTGQILSEGKGLAGVSITATNTDNANNVVRTTSKAGGFYKLALRKASEYHVKIEAIDHESQETNLGTDAGEGIQQDFTLVSSIKHAPPVPEPITVVAVSEPPKETPKIETPPPVPTPKKEVFVLKSNPEVVYKKDTVYTINDIYFDKNSAIIRFDSYTETSRLYELLNENPQARVQLSGYSNSFGDPRYNQQLSERRAKAVKDYLVSIGTDEKRLFVFGFGESELVYDNRGKEDPTKSRRVRFIIY